MVGEHNLSLSTPLFVCVLENPTLWGENATTKMTISKILVLVGTCFGLTEENSLHIILSNVFSGK